MIVSTFTRTTRVFCPRAEDAKKLLVKLKNQGYEWSFGRGPLDPEYDTKWECYGYFTYYFINPERKTVGIGHKHELLNFHQSSNVIGCVENYIA